MWQEDEKTLTCNHCGVTKNKASDPDPCLGKLSGVKGACCGHGYRPGYILFESGQRVVFVPVEVKHTIWFNASSIPSPRARTIISNTKNMELS